MKCPVYVQALVTVTVVITISKNSLSAPLNQNKLSLLDQQGYEIISGAEEFLTPVASEKDNRIDSPDGLVQRQKPDILLYGKFVVLRRKGFLHSSDKQRIGDGRSEHSLGNDAFKDPKPSAMSEIQKGVGLKSQIQEYQSNKEDVIVFPSEWTTNKKKYIRQRQAGSDEETPSPSVNFHNPFGRIETSSSTSTPFPELKASSSETRQQFPRVSRTKQSKIQLPAFAELFSKSIKSSQTPEEKTIEEIEGMTSDEFVEWTKWNLSTDQISQLLENSADDKSVEVEYEDGGTTESAIGYNSFIQVPSITNRTGCPEDQKKNHRGICTQIYKHNASLMSRITKGNAKTKLTSLFASLKAVDHMTADALIESEKELLKEAVRVHRELMDREITSDMDKPLSSITADGPSLSETSKTLALS